jgi:ribonuclease HI
MAKFYAVKIGYQSGIYTTWAEAEKQIKGYSGAIHKSFGGLEEAKLWLQEKSTSIEVKNISSYSCYTDGSCKEGRGGWAYVMLEKGQVTKEEYGSLQEYPTTNNRAELMAIYQALKNNPDISNISIYTDSRYVIGCLQEWYPSWERRGARLDGIPRKADGSIPENLDLIQDILALQKGREAITYNHVYGHKGNTYNERCDYLANLGSEKT